MSDRLKGFYVALHHDFRDDDAEPLRQAILQLKGVVAVESSLSTPEDFINRERIRQELVQKIWEALRR